MSVRTRSMAGMGVRDSPRIHHDYFNTERKCKDLLSKQKKRHFMNETSERVNMINLKIGIDHLKKGIDKITGVKSTQTRTKKTLMNHVGIHIPVIYMFHYEGEYGMMVKIGVTTDMRSRLNTYKNKEGVDVKFTNFRTWILP